VRILRVALIPITVILFALPGCREEDVIRKEEVTHEDREPLRLRTAFILRGNAVWFFNFTGPADLVKQHDAAFTDLVKSVKFDPKREPTIEFTVPNGWKQDPWSISPMTNGHNTAIRLKGQPRELEILVSEHSAKAFDLVKKAHDWQKKVNLPLAETHGEAEALLLKRVDVDGIEINWVDLSGLGTHTVTKPAEPMAQNKNKFLPGMAPKKQALPFKYKAPEEWVQKPPRQMILDAFEVGKGNDVAELTVSVFGGDIGANISRWRDQVGLPKVDGAELMAAAQKRQVAGIDSFVVDLDNPRGPAGANRILGAIIPVGRQLWFIKMTGPSNLVGQQKAAFDTFLDSFQRDAK
jgi:hypothetical protein